MREKKYWLMKTEGDCYSIDHLKKDKVTEWSGVRNYQARNFMYKEMNVGDFVLFYHSNDKPSGVYGIAKIASKPYPDSTQLDAEGEYYEIKATQDDPIWFCVDVRFVEKFKHPIALSELKRDPQLDGMAIRKKGDRLSIQPVSQKHFEYIASLARY